MLRVDLGRLGREGSLPVEARVSADDPLWEGTHLVWAGEVYVRLRATFTGTGEVVARGGVRGELRQECRRCLQPLVTAFGDEVTLVFVPSDSSSRDAEGDAYGFEPKGAELDLSEAVREEVLLTMNPYVVCDPDCRGLCSKCGANLNEVACGCTEETVDPRWAALRDLKDK